LPRLGHGHKTIPLTGEPAPNREGDAVYTIKFWASPAVLVALWIAAAAFTLSQLATVAPSLLSTGVRASVLEGPRTVAG
jgi:hypothetical protein